MRPKSLLVAVFLGVWAAPLAGQDADSLSRACDAGLATACNDFGTLLRTGEGVPQDLGWALALYRRACDGLEMAGCYNLGFMYHAGEGVSQDLAQAVGLYELACDGGDVRGCSSLGDMYVTGAGVAKDPARARSLYQQACRGGERRSCEWLGLTELRGSTETVAPRILNRMEVRDAMLGAYPPELRAAGIGGDVRVRFFLDAEGAVKEVRLASSSGHEELDQAAMSVAQVYRFSPARNGAGEPVPTWTSFFVSFRVR